MNSTILILGILGILLYALALTLSASRARQKNISKWHSFASSGMALIIHFVILWNLVVLHWVNLGFYHAISFASAFLVLVILITHRWQMMNNLLVVALPIAALSLGLEITHPEPVQLIHKAGIALDSHILLSLLAYSFLAIAAILAVISYWQEYLLKSKKLIGIFQSLPPLAEVETILFKVILLGFILLSASLFSGLVFLEDIFAQHLLHKTFFSILSWLIFAILLLGRARYGWRGSLATKLALLGFVSVVLAYFGSKVVLELVL